MKFGKYATGLLGFLLLSACSNETPPEPAGKHLDATTPDSAVIYSTDTLTDGELDGETVFLACIGCHSLEQGAPHKVGPNLFDIAGKAAGTRPGFKYSDALVEAGAKGLVWEQGTLLAWIMQTEGMVPGTWMLYYNALDANEINRLLEYILEHNSDTGM